MAKAKKMKTTKKLSKNIAKKAVKVASKSTTKKAVKFKTVAKKIAKVKAVTKSTEKKLATPVMNKPMAPAVKMATLPLKTTVQVGESVPDFTLASTGGRDVNLKEFAGKKVVLFFYPKDMTPGCTIEGHEFTKLKNEFDAHNTVVMGVSRDTVESHEKFKEKECYTIDLLSDKDEKLCNTFGVIKDKNMYGKMVRGIERSTFVINENGTVEHEWRGVKAEGHASEVLNYLRGVN